MKAPSLFAKLALVVAIVTEVIGTLLMKESGQTGNPVAYIGMLFCICISYAVLSFALREIAVGIAIAIWEGLGTALIVGFSILALNEPVNIQKLVGIALALLGIALLQSKERDA